MTYTHPTLKNRHTAKQARATQSGFTLIEIIVVVAIIGVMVAVLGVRLSRDTNRLAKLEAKRFHVVVNEVRDEAILAGENFLLNVDEGGSYSFSSVRQRESISDDGLLKPRKMQPGVKVRWDVFGDLYEEDDDEEEQQNSRSAERLPQVLISALGEITPFEIRFSGDQEAYTIFVDEENRLAQRDGPAGIF